MKPIQVAHIITRLCRGGAQENTFHTVRLLGATRAGEGTSPLQSIKGVSSSYEVDLISGPTMGPEGSLEPKIIAAGIPIVRASHLVRPARPWDDVIALRELTDIIRRGRYDIVHTHTSKAGFLGRWAARRAGVPHIVHTPHGHVFDGYFWQPVTQLYIRLEQWAARFTDRMIALTDDEIETYLRHGIGTRRQYTVISSGIELEPFLEAHAYRDTIREELGVRDAIVIGAVGRLEPVKGFDDLLSAAEQVRREIPNACFVIVGQGSREAELRRQSAPLGDAVRFLGYREDIAHIMAGCDIIAVPSRNEGMGRVVVEAGAAGLPVVATAVGGLPHVVDHERTGILTPPGDARSLADALVRLARDPALRAAMGEAARRKMIPAFGVGAMVSAIETVYDELMKEETRADRR